MMEDGKAETPERYVLTPEQLRRRRTRSIAIALGLAALAVMFFLVTIIRLGGNVADRSL
jgi:hypothetical protein